MTRWLWVAGGHALAYLVLLVCLGVGMIVFFPLAFVALGGLVALVLFDVVWMFLFDIRLHGFIRPGRPARTQRWGPRRP